MNNHIQAFLAALDKALELDKTVSAWALTRKGSPHDRRSAWLEVQRLRALLENTPVSTETFEQAWAKMERQGYHYGEDALESVRVGWEMATVGIPPQEPLRWPEYTCIRITKLNMGDRWDATCEGLGGKSFNTIFPRPTPHEALDAILVELGEQQHVLGIDSYNASTEPLNPDWCEGCTPDNCSTGCGRNVIAGRQERAKPCTFGVGCDEAGVCYASANGEPDLCGRNESVKSQPTKMLREVLGIDGKVPELTSPKAGIYLINGMLYKVDEHGNKTRHTMEPTLVVCRDGKPLEDQVEGVRLFKEACLKTDNK